MSKETGDKYEADNKSSNVIESSTKLNVTDELVNVKICDNTEKYPSAKEVNEKENVKHVESKKLVQPQPLLTSSPNLPTPLPCLTPSPG